MKSALINEIARFLKLDREALLEEGLKTLLQEKKRAVALERLQILSRFGASSKAELEAKLKTGELPEHPTWEDLIALENLGAELEKVDGYVRSLQTPARSR